MNRRSLFPVLPALFGARAFAQTAAPQIAKGITEKRVVERLPTDGKTTAWTLAKVPSDNAISGQALAWKRADVPAAADILGAKYWAEFNA